MVKEQIPEFNNGLGAANVHEESKSINDQILDNAREKGENIVLPIVGSDIEKVDNLINSFIAKQYDVYLHLNELPMYKALGRMITRYVQTGRFLVPDLIYKYQNKPTKVYEQIVNQEGGLLSGYSRYSNDVEYGERPIFKGGTEDFYAAFTGRYNEDIEASSGNVRASRQRVSDVTGTQKAGNVKQQSRTDTDYLSAVERGDMETAQKMVDEAAEKDIRYQSRDEEFDLDFLFNDAVISAAKNLLICCIFYKAVLYLRCKRAAY